MIKVSKYDIEPEDDNIEDDNIKETFYDLYNDIKEGRYRYTTNQSLQKELERFRDNMAVDFYNLQLEFGDQKHGLINRRDVKRCKPQIKDFKDRYFLWDVTNKDFDFKTESLISFLAIDEYLGMFRTITDKVIAKEKLTDDELQIINYWLCGKIEQGGNDSSGYVLKKNYVAFQNFGMIRALYEWVFLVSRGLADVGRCQAGGCNKLFIPYKPGAIEQIYCSKACKMREYRRRQKEIVTTE